MDQLNKGPTSVSLRNCSVDLVSGTKNVANKPILQPLSATITGGSLFAILGGSGCGKTTLLNVIAGRFSTRSYDVKGSVTFRHQSASSIPDSNATHEIGYVTQNDFLLPYLTAKETLMFVAHMRISSKREQFGESGVSGEPQAGFEGSQVDGMSCPENVYVDEVDLPTQQASAPTKDTKATRNATFNTYLAKVVDDILV